MLGRPPGPSLKQRVADILESELKRVNDEERRFELLHMLTDLALKKTEKRGKRPARQKKIKISTPEKPSGTNWGKKIGGE